MNRALVYLLLTRLKNSVFRLGGRPTRLAATLLLVGMFVLMITMRGAVGEDLDDLQRLHVLVSILALYFLLSLFGGLGEPGPIFQPSDVDFLFPAPFRRRDLLLYHLARHYLQMLLLALFYAVFLGAARMPNPVLAYLGIMLCLLVCTHVQTGMQLFSASISERAFGRLRLVTRVVLTGVLVVAGLLAIAAVAGAADVPKILDHVLGLRIAQVLFYPALAAGQLAVARDVASALPPLLGLLACVAASFGFVLLFPVDFVETATTRTERKRRAGGKREGRARSARIPSRLFGGGGAVAWLNAITLKRRLRMIVGAVVMMLVMLLFVGVSEDTEASGGSLRILLLLAFYAVIVQLPLGFKGHREHLELFKTLPVRPYRLALGEVILPALVLALMQLAIVGVFAAVGRLDWIWVLLAAVVYPVLDVGVVALSDLFQLGKDRQHMGFLVVTAQMLAMTVSLVPAIVAGAVTLELTGSVQAAAAAGVLMHVGVDLLLLRVLGIRFQRWEPAE